MFDSTSLTILLVIFLVASIIVWYTGTTITKIVDILDQRFNLGQALGGMIFLAIVTNLPEIAIVVSAAIMNNIELAIGNILGGIAFQTVVLAILDGLVLKNKAALTYKGASLQVVLEGAVLIIILSLVIMSTQLPQSLILFRLAPGDLSILLSWLVGLMLVSKARTGLPWTPKSNMKITQNSNIKKLTNKNRSTFLIIVIFITLSLVILTAGVALEETSRILAKHVGLSGAVFGATILAVITALPEISTGYEGLKEKEYSLVFSDIFGGNAFLPVLFLLATLITGKSTLTYTKNTDIYLTSLGILLTAIYEIGIIFRVKKQFFCLGIDSLVIIVIYVLGIVGLFNIK